LDKLIVLDKRIQEARRANDTVKVQEYTREQAAIVMPQQVEKIRVYLREHPIPASDRNAVTVWEEQTPATGVQVNTPLGSMGVGVPATTTRVEQHVVEPKP
jgi:hypothetical protein